MRGGDQAIIAAMSVMAGQLSDRKKAAAVEKALQGNVETPIRQEVLTAKEAATILSVDCRTIRKFAKEGFIQTVKLKDRERAMGYLRASVESLLKAGSKKEGEEK